MTLPHSSAAPATMPIYAMGLAIAVALIWGCNFAASKYAVLHFPPIWTIFLRYLAVTLLLLPFARRIAMRPLQVVMLSGLSIALHFTLVFAAIWLGLDLSITVIATQLGVPFSCLLGAILLKDYLGPWRSFGMAVSFAGIIVLAGTPSAVDNYTAFLLALAGTAAWAGSNVYLKMLPRCPTMPLLFWTALAALPQTLLASLLFEEGQWASLQDVPASAILGIAYSTIMSTIVAYGLWYWLLARYPVSQLVPFSLLVPIGGIASGVLFFGETLVAQTIIGALLTVFGVAIISLRHPRFAKAARE